MNDNLNFGQAIEALKAGKKVSRQGWNGKSMYLVLQEGSVLSAHTVRGGCAGARVLEDDDPTTVTLNPHIDMRSADGSIVVGWLASQTDMLSEGWCIVN